MRFQVELSIPEGFKLNELAPVTFRLKAEGQQSVIAGKDLNQRDEAKVERNTATIEVPLPSKMGNGRFQLTVTYSYCRDGKGGLCKFKTVAWTIPVTLAEKSDQQGISLKVE